MDEGALAQVRDERLQRVWAAKLREELKLSQAPVIAMLRGSLDPERAILMLAGKTRPSTLQRYVTIYGRWRLWLREATRLEPQEMLVDLEFYLVARVDQPCGRTGPEAILKTVSWIERGELTRRAELQQVG